MTSPKSSSEEISDIIPLIIVVGLTIYLVVHGILQTLSWLFDQATVILQTQFALREDFAELKEEHKKLQEIKDKLQEDYEELRERNSLLRINIVEQWAATSTQELRGRSPYPHDLEDSA